MIRRLLLVLETSTLHPHLLLEIECDLLALLPPLEPVMSAARRRRRGRPRGRRAKHDCRRAPLPDGFDARPGRVDCSGA